MYALYHYYIDITVAMYIFFLTLSFPKTVTQVRVGPNPVHVDMYRNFFFSSIVIKVD